MSSGSVCSNNHTCAVMFVWCRNTPAEMLSKLRMQMLPTTNATVVTHVPSRTEISGETLHRFSDDVWLSGDCIQGAMGLLQVRTVHIKFAS